VYAFDDYVSARQHLKKRRPENSHLVHRRVAGVRAVPEYRISPKLSQTIEESVRAAVPALMARGIKPVLNAYRLSRSGASGRSKWHEYAELRKISACCKTMKMISGPPTLEDQLSVLKQVKEAVDLNRSELELAFNERPFGTVAWLARNLLELAILSEHCAASKENAKEFLLDSARDACDAVNIPDSPLLLNSLQPVRQELLDKAASDGFDIEQGYARISSLARQLGRGDTFKDMNKMFSKYAHPTALAIFSSGSEAEVVLRQKFYELGCNLATSALTILNSAGPRIWEELQANKQSGKTL
jgi:hypothetical protein